MNWPVPPPAPHVRLLLGAIARPAGCTDLSLPLWDLLVRTARSARLLGVLASRVERQGVANDLPEPVANHLRAASAEARYLRQMTLRQLDALGETLEPVGTRLIALKGSAYILSGSECAEGRLPRDLDIMVAREKLNEVEQALLSAGWEFQKTDPYDQHYYRAWSHELPPMRAPAMPLELDVHHAILPPVGRLRPEPRALLEAAVPIPSDARWWVLCPADRLLHAAAHLFQDSDCINRLRDLFDIDLMLREFDRNDAGVWGKLCERARILNLGRPLWYALAFGRAWLGTPVPDAAWSELRRHRPPDLHLRLMASLAARVLQPVHPDAEAAWTDRAAASALEFRALWLRMPPWTLAYHGASKLGRLLRKPAGQSAAG